MNTIKAKEWKDIPINFTGIVEWKNGNKIWLKDDKLHREDGPAKILVEGYKSWYLDGIRIVGFYEGQTVNLTTKIILSKEPHPLYPTVQVWRWVEKDSIREQIIVSGMEEYITE